MSQNIEVPDLEKLNIQNRNTSGSKEMNTEEKLKLIKRNLQEVTDEEILDKIVAARPLKLYWGTATTGQPHIAYFLPMLKLRDFISAGCIVKILLADIHAFLDNLKAPMEKVNLRCEYYKKVIEAMLGSLDVDLSRIIFVKGSSFQLSKEYTLDLYKIASYATVHDSIKAGTQVVKQTENPLLSSLIYPNMQALDEEHLGVDAQFGGVDQRKIFMQANKYLPKLGYKRRAHLMNPMMPGLNSDKMSASDELSKIGFHDERKDILKKVKKCFCEPGNIATGVLFMFKYIIYPFEKFSVGIAGKNYATYQELEDAFGNEEIHPGDLKECCADIVDKIIEPIRNVMRAEANLVKKAYK
ncbi:tyrosyl-tRNA synthetase [Pancytospora epiphaga]|nr:tyrosyl-tRNA synthetase [Pancytospora epiphaga]